MRFYIGYKFTNITDKEGLKKKVGELAEHINTKGHTTFVLGRDIQDWHSSPFPMIKTLPHVFKNMLMSDCLISLITDNSSSTGLLVENILATVLLKKRGFLISTTVNRNKYNFLVKPEFSTTFNADYDFFSAADLLVSRLLDQQP